MKYLSTIVLWLLFTNLYAQLEISSGYAVNKRLVDGAPLHLGYDINIQNKFYTKSQMGFKSLYNFNDFVGVKLCVKILEFHQTLSYEFIKHRKFILKPNIGLNYRFYKWKGEMVPPINDLPKRFYRIGFSNNNYLTLTNSSEEYKGDYEVNSFGFTIQLQSQFKLNEKIWLHITPFLEPDFDRIQNTGGCYVGFIFQKT